MDSPPTTTSYTNDELWSMRLFDFHIPRLTRKMLFTNGLWRPFKKASCRTRLVLPTGQSSSVPIDLAQHRPPILEQTTPQMTSVSPPLNGLRIATWNVQSIRRKYLAVADSLLSLDLDLLILTESWHRLPTDVSVLRSVPPGYSFTECSRSSTSSSLSRGGGIIIYHRDTFQVKKIAITPAHITFEANGCCDVVTLLK